MLLLVSPELGQKDEGRSLGRQPHMANEHDEEVTAHNHMVRRISGAGLRFGFQLDVRRFLGR